MGLDMYLNRMPKIESYSFKELLVFESQIDDAATELPSSVKEKIITDQKYGYNWTSLHTEVGYWRKVNHIHNWFVENVQGGEDECNPYQVSKFQVMDLIGDVEKVMSKRDDAFSEEFLPTASGSFFGSTDFDEYYYESLEETLIILKRTLRTVNFDKEYLVYQSSW